MKTPPRLFPAAELLEPRIAPASVAAIQLDQLASGAGFRLDGAADSDLAGLTVHSAGDINGDGIDDLAIGATGRDNSTGAVYVVYGNAQGLTTPFDLSTLDGTNGFRIDGAEEGGLFGRSIASADINGDGKSDLIIGAPLVQENGRDAGAVYVLYGAASFNATLDIDSLNGTNGFKYLGSFFERVGFNVTAGDLNHDGFGDLVVGLPSSGLYSGAAVIFGKATGIPASLKGLDLNGTVGFRFFGDSTGPLGINGPTIPGTLVATGDVNGDHFDDLIVGSPVSPVVQDGLQRGNVYVLFGKATGFSSVIDNSALDGAAGFTLSGTHNFDFTGFGVASADLNKDGFSDLIIGAPSANEGGSVRGAVYVVFGKASWSASALLDTFDGSTGFKFIGRANHDGIGKSLAAADVNNDGFTDLIIGNENDRLTGSLRGAAYVVYGKASGFTPSLNPAALDGTNGFVIIGAAEKDFLGRDVAAAGDFNDDGKPDLILGAPAAGALDQGAAFVLLGPAAPTSLTIPDIPTAKIALNGKSATWVDEDGDRITVTTSKGKFTQPMFEFFPAGQGARLEAFALGGHTEFAKASINFTAKKVLGGDGHVNVGLFDASGVPLTTVHVPGDVSRIFAGEGVPTINTATVPGIKTLNLGSLHVLGGATEDPRVAVGSSGGFIFGGIGKAVVTGDIKDYFLATTRNGISSLLVKGNIIHSVLNFSAPTTTNVHILGSATDFQLALSGGTLGSFIVGKSFTSTGFSSIAAKTIGTINVAGALGSSDPAKPLNISATGNTSPLTAAQATAIRSVIIGGDVTNAQILAGYGGAFPFNTSAANIGTVLAKKNWISSSIVAGVRDTSIAGDNTSAADGFGQNDTLFANVSKLIPTIASITIGGTVSGTATTGDSFAFTAAKITRLKIGTTLAHLTPDLDDLILDQTNHDFYAVELG